ncbi:cytochrome-c oxidase [Sphingomonas populi]|uniref:Cytochrome-c oxidase n=1 Tax=Sphingomonas populi TaxID=2484750 RepID=A0A4Q6XKQ1_9SPHN|nr:cytochrome-c oxidase [Sphingomonas populi]
MNGPRDDRKREIRTYLIGYALALMLTGAAFSAVRWPFLAGRATFAAVLGLALVQIIVQFRCFLHISFRRSARDDLQLILFSTLIVALEHFSIKKHHIRSERSSFCTLRG